MTMDKTITQKRDNLMQALQDGRLCLHPTDSIPGLGFDPFNHNGAAKLRQVKGKRSGKTFIGLVSSLEKALALWQPLPTPWIRALSSLWPGPLSVIAAASNKAPPVMVANDSIALRVPLLAESNRYMAEVLACLSYPLPSTSVNQTGCEPLKSMSAAKEFLTQNFGQSVYVPPQTVTCQSKEPQRSPSTLIRISGTNGFEVLREGSVCALEIEAALSSPVKPETS